MTDPTQHDEVVDALLSRHFAAATSSFEPPQQPSIGSLLPARRPRNRWWAPAAVAGGLIAAATATVLVVSSSAPSNAPKVGVAPSGPSTSTSTSTSTTGSTSNDEGGEPAAQITVRGQEYTLVGAVPWYSAMRIGNTVAVTTGPETRGVCDTQIYRLAASERDGQLVLTSYRYDPVDVPQVTVCADIGLPPYVAALELDAAPPERARDGARSSEGALPLTPVLAPSELPDGVVLDLEIGSSPQLADPDRPSFPARPHSNTGLSAEGDPITQFYSGRNQRVAIRQGMQSFTDGTVQKEQLVVGRYSATLVSQGPNDFCLRWTDPAAGKVEVCGTLNGGADAMVAVARSIYAGSSTDPSTSDGTPSTDAEPAQRITVSDKEYQLIGPVPWYVAMRIGTTVAVTTGPKVRGACDTGIYRLTTSVRGDDLVLTSYHYEPVQAAEPAACLDIGLPPYVAALDVRSTLPGTVFDGARPSDSAVKLNRVLVPEHLPPGFTPATANGDFPQVPDPDRPVFPAYNIFDDGAIAQGFASGGRWLRVSQSSASYVQGPVAQGKATVGLHPATVYASPGSDERCVRWTDTVAGKMEVCGNLTNGADAVVAVARSIYS